MSGVPNSARVFRGERKVPCRELDDLLGLTDYKAGRRIVSPPSKQTGVGQFVELGTADSIEGVEEHTDYGHSQYDDDSVNA